MASSVAARLCALRAARAAARRALSAPSSGARRVLSAQAMSSLATSSPAALSVLPPPPAADPAPSAARASAGAFASMVLLQWPLALALPGADGALLFASFGSSACVLHVAPSSAFAHPRAIMLGHFLAAAAGSAAGAAAAAVGAAPVLAVPASVALAVGAMVGARCVHPPAAGTAIIAALSPLGAHILVPFVTTQALMLVGSFTLAARLGARDAASLAATYPGASWLR